jgi:hypothetical protein
MGPGWFAFRAAVRMLAVSLPADAPVPTAASAAFLGGTSIVFFAGVVGAGPAIGAGDSVAPDGAVEGSEALPWARALASTSETLGRPLDASAPGFAAPGFAGATFVGAPADPGFSMAEEGAGSAGAEPAGAFSDPTTSVPDSDATGLPPALPAEASLFRAAARMSATDNFFFSAIQE